MRKLYLIDLEISDCDSRKVDRFYAIMASFYTWSLRLFGNTMVIQTEDYPELIESALDECVSRIEKEEDVSDSIFGDGDRVNCSSHLAINDHAICELGDHLIILKDRDTSNLLDAMVRDVQPQCARGSRF